MSGSSASRDRANSEVLRLDDEVCGHCGRSLEAEWVEFPPALQRKFGKSGQWDYHPCTPECEKKNEQREWELMRREARVTNLREKSGLSRRLKSYTFANFKPFVSPSATKAAERVEDYLGRWEEHRETGRGLYLCGDVGTGKTHLAVAVMNELIRRKRVPALFVTVPDLLDKLRRAYNKDSGSDLNEWLDAVKNADLLLLDDLGSERPTDWAKELLFMVVNRRYLEALPTIFTSNIGPKDLAAHLGERTASRIIAMSEGLNLTGDDYRETLARSGR